MITLTIAMAVGAALLEAPTGGQPTPPPLVPRVDLRVELLAIAARLAAIPGFVDDLNPRYAAAIDRHFRDARNHPLIRHLRDQKARLGETPWELPAVAVHLGPPPALAPLMAFDETSNVDEWESRELFKAPFVSLLQQFYREARVDEFLRSQQSYFAAVNQRFVGINVNGPWIERFTGLTRTEEYAPIVALGMREGAYLRVNFGGNRRHTVTIFETTGFDAEGRPVIAKPEAVRRLMLHEEVHAFTNQLIDGDAGELRGYAEAILKNANVAKAMAGTFYGNWRYLLYESLVRAVAIKYLLANPVGALDVEQEIQAQEKAGFLWMRDLLGVLNEFEASRAQHRTLEAMMPRLRQLFRRTAENLTAPARPAGGAGYPLLSPL